MIEIDGSYGEGGGQILRTALSLSCLFKKPFRVFNIRKGRRKPGLMPQHLTCVKASQLISDAEVEGDSLGSTELYFSPQKIKGGDIFFDIGTAGSTSLVLQTIIPALIFGNEKATVVLKGGTHAPFSPSFHYIAEVFAPFLKRRGIEIEVSIDLYGFYPIGGGKVIAAITPVNKITSITIMKRGNVLSLKGYSAVANLPSSIAERQKDAAVDRIDSQIKEHTFPLDIELLNVRSAGQGTFVFLRAESEESIAGFTALGERGKKAEAVGKEAAEGFIRYYLTDAALDEHLADQIVLYLSMCREKSVFTTSCITQHLMTNLWAISQFHEFSYSIDGETGEAGTVRIN